MASMKSPIGSALLYSGVLDHDDLVDLRELIRKVVATRGDESPLASVLNGGEILKDLLVQQLSRDRIEKFCECGLLVESGNFVFSPFRAHRVEDFIIISDPPANSDSRASTYLDPLCEGPQLSKLLIRKRVNRGLDMGCGCGILSIAMASFCEHVLGVDVNARAIEVSHFNAELNGIKNVTFIKGDLFESIEDQFDLIVFNSPTNKEGNQYRDLLECGEPLLARFFSDVGKHLTYTGYCQVNLAMNDYPDSPFLERLSNWIRMKGGAFRALIMICKRVANESGNTWKRGWATFWHGGLSFEEIDWPYHLLSQDMRATDLSEFILRLIEHNENFPSRKRIPQ
jgi:methylase of polypeptide subunit release factors